MRSAVHLAIRIGLLGLWIEVLGAQQAIAQDPRTEHVQLAVRVGMLSARGQFSEAETTARRMLEMAEQSFGEQPAIVATSLNMLGIVYQAQGKHAEAEPLYERALAFMERVHGPDHPNTALALNTLAMLYHDRGKYREAEPRYKRALEIFETSLDSQHPNVALALNSLASLYQDQGRYAEAEPMHRRALTICEKAFGPEHSNVAATLFHLGKLCQIQGRNVEAVRFHTSALKIFKALHGQKSPLVAHCLADLANVYEKQSRYGEVELLYKQALQILQSSLGSEHHDVADNLNNLALLYYRQRRYAEAEPLYKQALAIHEKLLGPGHPRLGYSLHNLSLLYHARKDYANAQPLVDRAIQITDQARVAPDNRAGHYQLRADIAWKLDRKNQAIADLQQSLALAEQQRGGFAGAERETAEAFARYGNAYELMVQWQVELGNVKEAFAAIERSRARSLIDQMAVAHVDLLAGLPEAEASRLRQADTDARANLAALEAQLKVLDTRQDFTDEQRHRERERLHAALPRARQAAVDAYTAIRNASPAYRQAVGRGFQPASLGDVQRQLAGEDTLVLQYLLGDEAGYLVVIPPAGQTARIESLSVNVEQARQLAVDAGPLTATRLQQVLAPAEGKGLLGRLRHPAQSSELTQELHVLWHVLIPQPEREALRAGRFKTLIVLPDGLLASLPFDALVVGPGGNPTYLLDAGPPVAYGPSATVLQNLMQRPAVQTPPGREPVLTVGDPLYESGTQVSLAGDQPGALDAITVQSRYRSIGGQLERLPFSGWETVWLQRIFGKHGIGVVQFKRANATEANIRQAITGRQIVHLACHGLVDRRYGNLFGALALTPANPNNPNDDGFLTLAEVYELDLSGCKLAILSACDTNVGPEQRGEGAWALSRGFLVAGARRVVASNWVVDDEAAASLVSIFCTHLARAQAEENTLDYAEALRAAKRWTRNQEKWQSPYYWASMVLVGPPECTADAAIRP